MATYSIFGAGAAGLYTAWRLLSGEAKRPADSKRLLGEGDTLELFDWGNNYEFPGRHSGTREPGARVCTWHFDDDKSQSFLELGGMRYAHWDKCPTTPGHRLVTTVIEELNLDQYSVPFNISLDSLYFLRAQNFYLSDISSASPAPYNVDNYGATTSPDAGFATLQDLGHTKGFDRTAWSTFYRDGEIKATLPDSSVFQKGDLLKDIGYWNLLFDQLGSEGYNYIADGNGYGSNVINQNSAASFNINDEFTPGTKYRTLTTGYSDIFSSLFATIVKLARKKRVRFRYSPGTRLHSVLSKGNKVIFTTASRDNPDRGSRPKQTDAAWLAMPKHSLELVAQATRYQSHQGTDVLNDPKVQLRLQSLIEQPSYKIGMFFDSPWWLEGSKEKPRYPAKIQGWEITSDVLRALDQECFPCEYIAAIERDACKKHPILFESPYDDAALLIDTVELLVEARLTITERQQLLDASNRLTVGPSITDMPIRQVVYFGNNALDPDATPERYGILASYDDERYTKFWSALELGPDATRTVPESADLQTLDGPREAPPVMVKMLRKQLAKLHFGPSADYTMVPEPCETRYMDWSLPPFNAGYHAYRSHTDLADVQRNVRKPAQLIKGNDANIFIVGSAYSNDQAWVEGAFCTAESVLNDFMGIEPIISEEHYPFICPKKTP
ncbi:MAG: hypothetical protein ACRBK7_02925 [Acidimicrobiales bacterium]